MRRKKPKEPLNTKIIAKTPKRFTRTISNLKLLNELLLQNTDKEVIAEKLGMPVTALNKLYRPELEAYDAIGKRVHVPTTHSLNQAKTCGAIGLGNADIRRILGVSQQTFDDSYREAVEDGRAQGKLAVARELFRKATKVSDAMPNTTAAIYWSKVHMRWVEAKQLEISGPDGGPIQTQHAVVILPDNGRCDSSTQMAIDGSAE